MSWQFFVALSIPHPYEPPRAILRKLVSCSTSSLYVPLALTFPCSMNSMLNEIYQVTILYRGKAMGNKNDGFGEA